MGRGLVFCRLRSGCRAKGRGHGLPCLISLGKEAWLQRSSLAGTLGLKLGLGSQWVTSTSRTAGRWGGEALA